MTVILPQASVGLEGGRGFRAGGRGLVQRDSRGFVGITSCSVGNCTITSCLVVASNRFFSMFIALTCSWYEVRNA